MKFSQSQYRALSTLSSNAAAVFLASVVIPTVFGFDFSKLPVLTWGVVLTIILGILTVLFAERGSL